MSKKKKRESHNRDTTSTPVFVKPKNAFRGAKRYFILATLSSDNLINIELSANHQIALQKIKEGSKVIAVKTLKYKSNINDIRNTYVSKYQNATTDVFEKLDAITI